MLLSLTYTPAMLSVIHGVKVFLIYVGLFATFLILGVALFMLRLYDYFAMP